MNLSIKDIKNNIINKESIKLPLVFICLDDFFVAKTYIDAICENKNLHKMTISKLDDIREIEDNVFEDNNNLYVYEAPDELLDFTSIQNTNTIVLRKVDKDVDKLNIDYVLFPKITNKMLEEYFKALVPGLSEEEVSWICSIAKYDVFRLNNEALKLSIFSKDEQHRIFEQMILENGYRDLTNSNIFDFTNALMKKDFPAMNKMLRQIEAVDIEGLGLVTILIRQYKNIVDVLMNSKAGLEKLKMSEKQINYIRYSYGKLSLDKIVHMLKFLTGIDCKLKNGDLDIVSSQLVTYILGNVFE